MIKLSKKVLFILIISMTVCAGISLNLINWENINSTQSFFKEFHLTLLCLCLALYFVFPYVKSLNQK